MTTAADITDEIARALAKVRCAEHISQRIKGPIPRAVSDLASGRVHPNTIIELRRVGLVGWNNGSVLTPIGAARLDEILSTRAAGHVISQHEANSKHHARCSCGWQSKPSRDFAVSRDAANAHFALHARAASKDGAK